MEEEEEEGTGATRRRLARRRRGGIRRSTSSRSIPRATSSRPRVSRRRLISTAMACLSTAVRISPLPSAPPASLLSSPKLLTNTPRLVWLPLRPPRRPPTPDRLPKLRPRRPRRLHLPVLRLHGPAQGPPHRDKLLRPGWRAARLHQRRQEPHRVPDLGVRVPAGGHGGADG